MLPPTTIVFDLDGTLVDSRGDIVASVNYALMNTGRGPLPAEVIVRYVGDGARTLLARSAQLGESEQEVDLLVAMFVNHYATHPVDFTRWAPGAQEALEALAEIPEIHLGLCTNKPRPITDAVLSALGIRTRFRAIVAGGDLPEKKPAAGPLLHIAKALRTSPETIVMVGDGPPDIECARRAKARSVAVESNFYPRERVVACHPDVFLKTLFELPDVIHRWRDATARIVLPLEKVRG